ncbi:hypothetical protein M3B11_00495 [Brevibacterium sp. p3-SID960]|nr:hypothetical protein [Brevibacterium sp. p3-SID960]MCT1689453.1 hypothetical protein [Brevibacterium sp. p3-SID960]
MAVVGAVPEAMTEPGADRVDDPDAGGDEGRDESGQSADGECADDAQQRR